MIRRPPRSTRTDTLFPYTTLFRSLRIIAWRLTADSNLDPGLVRLADCLGDHPGDGRVPLVEQLGEDARVPVHAKHELGQVVGRSEEHTSELQSLMRISYAVFCLKKKKQYN